MIEAVIEELNEIFYHFAKEDKGGPQKADSWQCERVKQECRLSVDKLKKKIREESDKEIEHNLAEAAKHRAAYYELRKKYDSTIPKNVQTSQWANYSNERLVRFQQENEAMEKEYQKNLPKK